MSTCGSGAGERSGRDPMAAGTMCRCSSRVPAPSVAFGAEAYCCRASRRYHPGTVWLIIALFRSPGLGFTIYKCAGKNGDLCLNRITLFSICRDAFTNLCYPIITRFPMPLMFTGHTAGSPPHSLGLCSLGTVVALALAGDDVRAWVEKPPERLRSDADGVGSGPRAPRRRNHFR